VASRTQATNRCNHSFHAQLHRSVPAAEDPTTSQPALDMRRLSRARLLCWNGTSRPCPSV
jgi:hypothetical protein